MTSLHYFLTSKHQEAFAERMENAAREPSRIGRMPAIKAPLRGLAEDRRGIDVEKKPVSLWDNDNAKNVIHW